MTTPQEARAFLAALSERVDRRVYGVTYPLPQPFFVLATQNPVELEGTLPLPEAQLDRFLVRVRLGYPDEADEERILEGGRESRAIPRDPLPEVPAVADLRALVDAVRMEAPVRR